MWVTKLHIEVKQIFIGVITGIIFVFAIFDWGTYFSWLLVGVGLGTVGAFGYLMYTQGFFVRLYPNIWRRNGSWEVRKFIKPSNLNESYIVLHDGRTSIPKSESSSIYLKDRPEWKCLDILRIVLENGKVPSSPRFLILGSGGGSFIYTLLKRYKNAVIDAVEISQEVIWIAMNYFLKSVDLSNVHMIQEDGLSYLKTIKMRQPKYDCVIIDMFSHTSVPDDIFTSQFIKKVKSALAKQGIVFVNFGIVGFSKIDTHKIKQKYGRTIKNMSLYMMGKNLIGTNVKLNNKGGSYVSI